MKKEGAIHLVRQYYQIISGNPEFIPTFIVDSINFNKAKACAIQCLMQIIATKPKSWHHVDGGDGFYESEIPYCEDIIEIIENMNSLTIMGMDLDKSN